MRAGTDLERRLRDQYVDIGYALPGRAKTGVRQGVKASWLESSTSIGRTEQVLRLEYELFEKCTNVDFKILYAWRTLCTTRNGHHSNVSQKALSMDVFGDGQSNDVATPRTPSPVLVLLPLIHLSELCAALLSYELLCHAFAGKSGRRMNIGEPVLMSATNLEKKLAVAQAVVQDMATAQRRTMKPYLTADALMGNNEIENSANAANWYQLETLADFNNRQHGVDPTRKALHTAFHTARQYLHKLNRQRISDKQYDTSALTLCAGLCQMRAGLHRPLCSSACMLVLFAYIFDIKSAHACPL